MSSGIIRSRSVLRYLAVDPEIYPLVGILAGVAGAAGYMLGRKGTAPNPEDSVKLSKVEAYPWHSTNQEDHKSEYKYKFHKHDNPEEIVKAPSAVASHTVQVDVPKDVAQKVEEKFEQKS